MQPRVGEKDWQTLGIGDEKIWQISAARQQRRQQGDVGAVLRNLDRGLAQAFEAHAGGFGIGSSRNALNQGLHGMDVTEALKRFKPRTDDRDVVYAAVVVGRCNQSFAELVEVAFLHGQPGDLGV